MTDRRRRRAQPNDANAVVVRQQQDEWVGEVVTAINRPDRTQQLASLLGSDAAVERFKTVVLHAIVHDQAKLRDADPLSVIEAVREAASLGLEPTGVLGEAWILPYGRTARLSVGYRGLLKLIRRSRAVAFVDAQLVYMADVFDVQFGTDPRIVHKPLMFGERDPDTKELTADRGGYRGAYAWAEIVGTTHPLIEWMPTVDIEEVRKASPSVKAGRESPWDNWWGEMARKSPLRRLSKRLPLDPIAERALAVDEETDDIAANLVTSQTKSVSSPARAAAVAAIEARRPAAVTDPAGDDSGPAEGESTDPDDDPTPDGGLSDDEIDQLSTGLDPSEAR